MWAGTRCGVSAGAGRHHHSRNRHELESFILKMCEQVVGCYEGLGAVDSESLVTAIVKKDYVAAADLLGSFVLDLRG